MNDLDNLRIIRSYIKKAIDAKHNEWLEAACNGTDDQIVDKMAETIGKLYEQLEATDQDIINTKQQLIEEALNA